MRISILFIYFSFCFATINFNSYNENISNNDVWVQTIDQAGAITTTWTPVDTVVGSNVIFNAVDNNIRDI